MAATQPQQRRTPIRRRLLLAALWVLWVTAVTVTITPLVTPSRQNIGPGIVALQARPAWSGSTTLSLPPFGRVSASTHRGPVHLQAEVRELDLQPLVSGTTRLDLDTLENVVRDDLPGAIRSTLWRLGLVATLIGAAAAAVLPHRGPRRVLGGGVLGLASMAALIGSAVPGMDLTRFEEPTYEGSLAAGGSLLNSITSGADSPIRARIDALSDRIAGLYSAAVTTRIGDSEGDVSILHVSDLHLNPIGVELTRQMATSFGVDAIIDTGDTTSFGLPLEADFAALFDDFPVPFYYVGGNHDSPANRAALGAAGGVTPIHRKVVDIEGVRVLGFDDPVVTSTRRVPRTERAAITRAAAPQLVALIDREHPDLVATHNPAMAAEIAGHTPLVIAGHLHRFALGSVDGTLVAVVGSTGATGLESLTLQTDRPYQAQILRFSGGDLVAIDAVELTGTSGDFQVHRHLITPDDYTDDTNADTLESDPDEPQVARTTTTPPSTATSTPDTSTPTSTPAGGP